MHSENFDKNKVNLINIIAFALGFLDAFLIYILSSYFSGITGSDNVGIFYLVAYSGVLGVLFFLQPLIRRIGKAHTLYLSLGVTVLMGALLARMEPSWLSIGMMLVFIVATNTTWVALDILLESFSMDQMSGRIRGLHLTIMNAGLLLAPFLSTRVLDRAGFSGVFFLLLIGYSVIFLVTILSFRRNNVVFLEKLRLRDTFGKMLWEKNLLFIYSVSFAMEFFYALMIVYTPLHLRSLGFSWEEIGILFTVMLVPFVLLQYPLGMLADRRLGEKELLITSLLITLVSTISLWWLDTSGLAVWGTVLFCTRVGIAGIEILRDSYFYKQIDGNDMDVIAFFRTARPVANIVGAVLMAVALSFFPIKSAFILVAAVLIVALVGAFLLEDTQSEWEREQSL